MLSKKMSWGVVLFIGSFVMRYYGRKLIKSEKQDG